jgi:hypothetical protein
MALIADTIGVLVEPSGAAVQRHLPVERIESGPSNLNASSGVNASPGS